MSEQSISAAPDLRHDKRLSGAGTDTLSRAMVLMKTILEEHLAEAGGDLAQVNLKRMEQTILDVVESEEHRALLSLDHAALVDALRTTILDLIGEHRMQ